MNRRFPTHEIWVYLSGSPLMAPILTLTVYQVGFFLYGRSNRHPLVNPVAIAVMIVAVSLELLDLTYAYYFEGTQFVHFLLDTATVLLAVLIYRGLRELRGRMLPLVLALIAGGLASIAAPLELPTAWAPTTPSSAPWCLNP